MWRNFTDAFLLLDPVIVICLGLSLHSAVKSCVVNAGLSLRCIFGSTPAPNLLVISI